MSKLILADPVTPIHFNQHFGTNGAYYQANGIHILGHNGCDFQAFHGQPIYAAHDGIAYYEKDDSGGHGVVIITNDQFDYKDGLAFFKTIYWHMCDPIKEAKYASPVYIGVGRKANGGKYISVKKGDLIGFADSTGLSTGDHLHFGLKPITPGSGSLVGDAPDVGIGNWANIEQDNGYLGAIDPEPYFPGYVPPAPFPAVPTFTRDLFLGAIGEDVRALQKYLNARHYAVAGFGPGSPGFETTFYGPATVSAVARLQKAAGLSPSVGYFGALTRKWVANHP